MTTGIYVFVFYLIMPILTSIRASTEKIYMKTLNIVTLDFFFLVIQDSADSAAKKFPTTRLLVAIIMNNKKYVWADGKKNIYKFGGRQISLNLVGIWFGGRLKNVNFGRFGKEKHFFLR